MPIIKTTIPASPCELYPVVQDLTDAEYSKDSTAGLCCGEMLGGFSLEAVLIPNLKALQIPTLPGTATPKNTPRKQKHNRGHSLFQLNAAVARNSTLEKHKRSNSAPNTMKPVPSKEFSSTTVSSTMEDETQRLEERLTFDDIFVLTRQVRDLLGLILCCIICNPDFSLTCAVPFVISQIHRCNVSTVWECVHRENGNRYCVKIIDKRRFTSRNDNEAALAEISILKSLQTKIQHYQSRHLPRLIQVTEDEKKHYIVMDYVEGGNLLKVLQSETRLSEDDVQAIARSLLMGVAEMHRLSLGHFNISTDNIVLRAGNSNEVALCDFGCARDLRHTSIHSSFVRGQTTIIEGEYSPGGMSFGSTIGNSPRYGDIHYAAPELVGPEKEFGLSSDLWSVGVVLYELLSGRLPFEDNSRRALKQKIMSGKCRFHGKEWNNVSRSAKQFISILLHPDPQVRVTVGEALGHPWLLPRRPLETSMSPSKNKGGKLRTRIKRLFRISQSLQPTDDSEYYFPPSEEEIPVVSPFKQSSDSHVADLSSTSTLTDVDSSFGTGSSPASPRRIHHDWSATLPRPLDEYRRSRSLIRL